MDKMRVLGGGPLKGEVTIGGAKNAALPIIFSTLLAEGNHQISNVPALRDIDSAMALLNSLGCSCSFTNNRLSINVGEQLETLAHYDQVRKMRASFLVLGPLLARYGKAKVSLPGGCAIGARPVGMHLDGLKTLGAKIEVESGYVIAECDRLKGTRIDLPFPTVGGTENLMMAACLAEGTTEIHNAAQEPEIEDLADYLNAMGAKVSGAGTATINIEGQEKLAASSHEVIPDRIEAGTFLVAGAITGGDVIVKKCRPSHLRSFTDPLVEMGVELEFSDTQIHVKPSKLKTGIELETQPHPGFHTDLQAQMMVLLTQAPGVSTVTESVFENRFMHVSELLRMGAKIDVQGKTATISAGPQKLKGAPVMATDLRASASLILAGLVAEGETLVSRIYHLDRGYEKIEEKLQKLGADVKRIKE